MGELKALSILRWDGGTLQCLVTALGREIPASRDAGGRIQLVMSCGPFCALLAAPLLQPQPSPLSSAPSARHVTNLPDGKLLAFFFPLAMRGNWHLLVCLRSLFLSALCTLTSPLASLSPRLSDLWLFHRYLDADAKETTNEALPPCAHLLAPGSPPWEGTGTAPAVGHAVTSASPLPSTLHPSAEDIFRLSSCPLAGDTWGCQCCLFSSLLYFGGVFQSLVRV